MCARGGERDVVALLSAAKIQRDKLIVEMIENKIMAASHPPAAHFGSVRYRHDAKSRRQVNCAQLVFTTGHSVLFWTFTDFLRKSLSSNREIARAEERLEATRADFTSCLRANRLQHEQSRGCCLQFEFERAGRECLRVRSRAIPRIERIALSP
jgi:hypothetical protein